MEEFRKRYVRICREHQIFPLEPVLHIVRQTQDGDDPSARLDLSSYNMTPEDCHALAKAISDDFYFEDVSFSDCLLSEEACKLLLLGLMENKSIKQLNLKGNNIRCGGAEVVGHFLKRNISVRSLLLEWNSLGLWDSGMIAIAEGLAVNQVLMYLDLRNNQVTHEGAGQLANALKRNRTLKGIDLRWNNIGLLGGRELLSLLKYNKTLTCLEITGNNIPQDIVRAVSVSIKQNADRQAVYEEQRAQTELLNRELQKVEELKKKEVLSLRDELEKGKQEHERYSQSTQSKIDHLRATLDDRKKSFNSISAKLSSTEADLGLAQDKCANLENLVKTLKNELSQERDERTKTESKYQKQTSIALQRNLELENTINILERRNNALEQKVSDLEREVESILDDFTQKGKLNDRKFKDEMAETEQKLQKELNSIKEKSDEYNQAAKEKLNKLENERNKLEQEVSSLKSEVIGTKLRADEELMNTKSKLRQEEMMRAKQYDERISILQLSRDELQTQTTKQLSQITDLQSQLSNSSRECDSAKRQIDALKQQLEQREVEYRNEVGRARSELDSGRKTESELRDRISSLESKMTDLTRRHQEAITAKEKEVEFCNDHLKSKENELKRMREDEVKRAELLEKAIYSYVSSAKSSQPGSPYRG